MFRRLNVPEKTSLKAYKQWRPGYETRNNRLPSRFEPRRLSWPSAAPIEMTRTRILLYGFGPYRQFNDNVTARILREVPHRRWLKKAVFPVKFQRSQFIQAVEQFTPDVILGLGQCSRGRLLRIETRAINKRRSSKKEKARPIVARGAPKLLTHYRFQLRGHARRSRNAGDYVCNYSMYVILDFLKRRQLPIRFGFVHVPCRYDVMKAARLLEKTIGDIRRSDLTRRVA
jgi:pyroglutamyl-peptidase